MLMLLVAQITACKPSAQEIQSCNQTINEALKLVKPYSDWFQVLCTEEGQVIKPATGYQWSSAGISNIYLNNTGDIQPLDDGVNYQNGMELQSAYGEKKRIAHVIKNYNDMLHKLKPDVPEYDEVHSLGFRGNMPFTYNFFILAKDSQPEYMVLCQEQCHIGEQVLIEVKR